MFPVNFTLLLLMPIAAMNNGDYLFMLMLPIACSGAFLNWCATSSNGGKMPVKMYPDIVVYVLMSSQHIPMTEATRHRWLCDYIRIGKGMTMKVVSIGDLVVFFGCILPWFYIFILILREAKLI
jgi:hypothetical protein